MMLRTLLIAGLAAASLNAVAEDHSGHHGHHAAPATAKAEAPSTVEFQQANAVMHKDMDIAFTGDADIDFLRGMIAHHQGAVEMARVQLRYGRDAKVTRLAQEIIRAQNLEIAWMQKWLAQLEAQPRKPIVTEPRSGSWNDANWSGRTWLGER
ncbi:MAG: DUF305 domain-containing protein [Blastochloris viridis]|uniref:DUF305 domain-containing protein n=1 Tax=Blastochloris viridis TaxID=1079 RepID=A0A6N4RA04_BLAVI|nr:MAG: DUF305 domain-containing protein [Blastochloris viridis]